MKTLKYILSVLSIFILNTLYAQNGSVGINTTTPNASTVLDITSNPTGSETHKGVLFPRMTTTQRNAIVDPANGLMIYNTSISCLQVNDGTPASPNWNCISGNTSSGTVATLNCAGAIHNGTLKENEAASGVSSTIPYTNGNGSSYNAQSVSSIGVTGLTANLEAGNFVNGSGTLSYTITGTPSSTGIASFTVSIGGQTCSFSRNVIIDIPTTIELAQNSKHFIISVYDQDYWPYIHPTNSATANTQIADGINEPKNVNVQGQIPPESSAIIVKLPVSITGSGNLPAYSSTISIPSDLTEDGVTRNVTLAWESQSFNVGDKFINAKIYSTDSNYIYIKKLDVNSGNGNDYMGVLLGSFTYPNNNAGNVTNFQLRVIAGIPDRMFGKLDNAGVNNHLMIYQPILAEDGKIWLNNNLGAHYSDINHPNFNPTQQAKTETDYLAYGSKFQWGRKPDGHELINYTGPSSGTFIYASTTDRADNPINSLKIVPPNTPYDWRITQDNTLWSEEASNNNPCPQGFRVPTDNELSYQSNFIDLTDIIHSSSLKFTTAGLDFSYGSFGYYWSSSAYISTDKATLWKIAYGFTQTDSYFDRINSAPIRCIKD